MNNSVGNKLKQFRKIKSMSQEQVADYLHLSQSAYARMENGESHSWASHIDKICEIFEITPEELVKSENMIIGNIGTNNGVGYAEIVNSTMPEGILEKIMYRLEKLEKMVFESK